MEMDVNHDCLRSILDFASLDTLAKLLRVNKLFFNTIVPIIYSDPFTMLDHACAARNTRVDADQRQHLNYVIALCSGYAAALDAVSRPPYANAPALPTTVNYYDFVKVMPSHTVQMMIPTREVAWVFSPMYYFPLHAEKFIEVEVTVQEIKYLTPVARRLICLKTLWVEIRARRSPPTEAEKRVVDNFAQLHRRLFPNMLIEVRYKDLDSE